MTSTPEGTGPAQYFASNPFAQAFLQNPYPLLDFVRQMTPAFYEQSTDMWFVTRSADADPVLRSPMYGKDPRKAEGGRGLADLFVPENGEEPTMLVLDPPDHTRLRGLVNKAFTPHVVEAQRPRLQQIVDELLDVVAGQSGFDLMPALAVPLPIRIISEMIGVDPAEQAQFRAWSHDLATGLDINAPLDVRERAGQAVEGLFSYFERVIGEHRASPRDDLASGLIAAQEGGARLSDREMQSILTLLLVAGNVTTTDLIGNGVLALLEHPQQLEKLQDDPSLIANAVEEMLRYDSPVLAAHRVPLQDVEIGGCPVHAHQAVVVSLAGANHDPAAYENPSQFEITRKNIHHHSFGGGPHYCLGAPLARLEATIAVGTLVQRFPSLRLDPASPPQRRGHPAFRSMASLHLLIAPEGLPSPAKLERGRG